MLFQDGGTLGSLSTPSEGEWISGRWSPGVMEEKWRRSFYFSNSSTAGLWFKAVNI